MFDDKISIFRAFDKDPRTITLDRWIRSTMTGGNEFAQQVKQYRQTGADHLKKSLPLATVGALLTGKKDWDEYPKPGTGYRVLEQVEKRTGWIALDVDSKDNPQVEDAAELRDAISRIVYVAFAGLSVSGKGVWALVKVEDPQKQHLYFEKLQKDFGKFNIALDSTKGKNPHDARFYSFDPEAYITDDFQIYDRLPKKRPSPKRVPSHSFNGSCSLDDTRNKVETLISKIQQQRIDITPGYENWISLAFAIEDEFGENGRDYFHAISEFNSEYDPKECDRQFMKCVQHRGRGIGIGTFFHKCREYGITLDRNHVEPGDNRSQSKYEGGQNENPAPYGMNPYTGEIFDERGYPKDWDEIQLDEDPNDFERLKLLDSKIDMIEEMFDAELESQINFN